MTPDQEKKTWQYRAIAATRGQQTMLGTVLLAVLGKALNNPPMFSRTARITSDGYLVANFIHRSGERFDRWPLGKVKDVVEQFWRLADTIKATEEERAAMMAEVRKWVATDDRATSNTTELQ